MDLSGNEFLNQLFVFIYFIMYLHCHVFLYMNFFFQFWIHPFVIPYFEKEVHIDFLLPNLFVVLEWTEFWQPLSTWLAGLCVIPLAFSYFLNLEPTRYSCSPLTYSMVKFSMLFYAT